MSDPEVIIIGGGVAGLTCGCLLVKNGVKVLLIEKNQEVGGCCTSFERDGFSFDLSVQSIGECQKGGRIWRLLEKLDLLDKIHFITLEPAREYHFPDRRIIQSSSLETHIDTLAALFPKERKGIEKIYRILRQVFEEFSRIPPSLDWFNPATFSSQHPLLSQYKNKTYGELLEESIAHPLLKTILSIRTSYALLPPEEISVVGMAAIEMSYFSHGVSCIEGKVDHLPLQLRGAFERLGGQLLLEEEVLKVLVEGKKATGVILGSGQEIKGKMIVSNIDALTTFVDLIEEDLLPGGFRSKLRRMRPSLSYYILYLGIDGNLDELSISNNEVFPDDRVFREYQALNENQIPKEAPFYLLAPSKVNPSHAPEGKSTLCLSVKAPYHFSPIWDEKVKNQLSEELIAKASPFVPHLKERIEVRVETTPKTIEQRTGNRLGAAYGWSQTPSQSGIYRLNRMTPISNLYLTGHWTSPGGGISGVVASGELTAEIVLNKLS